MGELSEAEKLLAQRVAEEKRNQPERSFANLSGLLDGTLTQRRFDFTTEKDVAEEIADQVDSLSQTQLKLLKEQMEQIIKNSKEDEQKESKKWFERSVIPILRNFAETASATLEISDEDETVISATFQNKCGYDLTENDRHMRMLVGLSNYVSIEKNGDNIVLVLAFDCLDMK